MKNLKIKQIKFVDGIVPIKKKTHYRIWFGVCLVVVALLWAFLLWDGGLFLSNLFPKNKTAVHLPQIAYKTGLIEAELAKIAQEYGINEVMLIKIAKAESNFNPLAKGDGVKRSKHISRGMFQINSYYHPEVSDECAFSWYCSAVWTAEQIANGNCDEWTTARNLFPDKCKRG